MLSYPHSDVVLVHLGWYPSVFVSPPHPHSDDIDDDVDVDVDDGDDTYSLQGRVHHLAEYR